VAVEEIDELEIQPLQRPLDRLEEVLAIQRVAHVHAAVNPPEELGGDDV
jgi:hypothetical protein